MQEMNRREFLKTGACASLALAARKALWSCTNNAPAGPSPINARVAALRGDNLDALTRGAIDALGGMQTVVMKTVFVTLVVAFFFLSFGGCEHSVDYTQGEFGIYPLADSTVTAGEAMQQPLDAVILSQSPIISVDDITYYKWSDHSFALKPAADFGLRILLRRRQTVQGIPFIVIANDERIYLGAFWFAYSSIAPFCPYIEGDFAIFEGPLAPLLIEKSWIDSQPDMRNDQRIYRALKSAGVLIE